MISSFMFIGFLFIFEEYKEYKELKEYKTIVVIVEGQRSKDKGLKANVKSIASD